MLLPSGFSQAKKGGVSAPKENETLKPTWLLSTPNIAYEGENMLTYSIIIEQCAGSIFT